MNIYILLITLIFNFFILFLANKYKNKLNIGTIFLYIQTAVVVSNVLSVAQLTLVDPQYVDLISFSKCTFYSSTFIIAYFIYLLSVAINNIGFKIQSYFTLAVPTLIAISLLYTNSFSEFMIAADGTSTLLFKLFLVYHFILGAIGLIKEILFSYKMRKLPSTIVSLLCAFVFVSGVLVEHLRDGSLLDDSSQVFATILFSLITTSILNIVKDYKYDVLSKRGLVDSILSLNSGILTYNIFDKILHTNDTFQTVLDTLDIDYNMKKSNYSFSELLKKFSNNGNAKIIEKNINKAKETKKYVISLLTFKVKGELIYFKLKIYPLYKNDIYTGCMLLFNNITTNYLTTKDNIKQETQVFTQSKIDTISEMIGCIVHDINTPLSTIKTGTSLLLDKYKDDEFKLELLEQIDKNSKKISSTSVKVRNQIRTLGNDTISDFSVNELIENIKLTLVPDLHKHNAAISIEDLEEDVKLTGNYSKLFQSMYNIVLNAIEAYNTIDDDEKQKTKQTEKQKTKQTEQEQEKQKTNEKEKEKNKITISAQKDEKDITIKIQDYAGGINDTILPQIFSNIITTTDGTALGLYLAYSIITSHFNGDVYIDVKKSVGTTVTVSIPLKQGGN